MLFKERTENETKEDNIRAASSPGNEESREKVEKVVRWSRIEDNGTRDDERCDSDGGWGRLIIPATLVTMVTDAK